MNISASHRSIDKGHLVKTFSKKYGDLYGSFTKRGKKIGRKHFCALFLFDFAVKLFISK